MPRPKVVKTFDRRIDVSGAQSAKDFWSTGGAAYQAAVSAPTGKRMFEGVEEDGDTATLLDLTPGMTHSPHAKVCKCTSSYERRGEIFCCKCWPPPTKMFSLPANVPPRLAPHFTLISTVADGTYDIATRGWTNDLWSKWLSALRKEGIVIDKADRGYAEESEPVAPVVEEIAEPIALLVTGSRKATDMMLVKAFQAVERAKANGWTVIVGDADGVDAAVIEACDILGVKVQVWGAMGELRHKSKTGKNNIHNGNYLGRDRHMCTLAGIVLAIWNDKSPGTRYTFEYAQSLGLTVHVMHMGAS